MAGKTKKIVQVLAADAELHIRREAALLDRLFREWGWNTEIQPIEDVDSHPSKSELGEHDYCLIHFDGRPIPASLIEHPGYRIALILHDYVPAKYHHLYSEENKTQLMHAGEQLRELSSKAAVCIGHSEKAEGILERLGASTIRQVPLLFDFSAVRNTDDVYTAQQFKSGIQRILYAGEIDGESGFEDLLKSVWYFRSFIESDSDNWQLFSVGKYDRCEGSMLPVQLAVKHYEISQGWLEMAPTLEDSQLDTAFRYASFYASFDRGDLDGAGLVQAIASGVPVIAVAEGAGSTVLGDSPLLFDEPIHSAVAESMSRLQQDKQWRKKVLGQQQERLELYGHDAIAFTLKSIFRRF